MRYLAAALTVAALTACGTTTATTAQPAPTVTVTQPAPAAPATPAPAPAAAPPATDTRVDYAALTRELWDQQTPDDQAAMCMAWLLDPKAAKRAFVRGAGADGPTLWPYFVRVLQQDCLSA